MTPTPISKLKQENEKHRTSQQKLLKDLHLPVREPPDHEPVRYTELEKGVEFDIDTYFDFEGTKPEFQIKQKSGKGDYDELGLERYTDDLTEEEKMARIVEILSRKDQMISPEEAKFLNENANSIKEKNALMKNVNPKSGYVVEEMYGDQYRNAKVERKMHLHE